MAQETIVKGKLSFPKSEIIDRGNTSSVIFKGLFEKKTPVAIKRVLKVGTTVTNEAEHLREHDRHENIVRYYTTEEDG